MNVLFINSRTDARQHPGGDTVQLDKTRAALECLGVQVDLRAPNDLESLGNFDLAHIFNIQEPEPAWAAVRTLHKRGIPTVLSPIFWDLYAYEFNLAVDQLAKWRLLARLFGKRRLGEIYIRWQRMKAPTNRVWELQRRVLLEVDRILPNSSSEIEVIRDNFALPPAFADKADVIPNAIDTRLYESAPAPSEKFLQTYGVRDFILEVGRIYPVKNQLELIEAVYDLPVPLVFVGQQMEAFADYVEACKVRAGQRGNVYFIDPLSYDELPGVYALARVHALPSWRETPGLVSLEAAAAGCRIVTTSIGSTRDYFGDLAWYCSPDDRGSIRTAVEAALKAKPSTALRQRVMTEYTWDRAAQATLASYHTMLAKLN